MYCVGWLLFSMSILHRCWSSLTHVWMLLTNGALLLYTRHRRKDEHSSAHCLWVCFSLILVVVTIESTDIKKTFDFSFCLSVFVVTAILTKHTHTHPFNGPFPRLPKWAGTRKVKPIWILLKQETVTGSGISWATCKSAPHSWQTTTPAPHHSVFYRPDALPAAQPTVSKHWRNYSYQTVLCKLINVFISILGL